MVTSAQRKVWLLALGYSLGLSCSVIIVSISALSAVKIGMKGFWVTAPYGVMFLVQVLASFWSAAFFHRFGRRKVFLSAALCAVMGGLLGGWSVLHAQPIVFVLGHGFMGITLAFNGLYRFAAFEIAEQGQKERATSLVVFGGIASAIIGPSLVRNADALFPFDSFAAPLFTIAILGGLIFSILLLFTIKQAAHKQAPKALLGLGVIVKSERLICGVIVAAFGYGLMVFLMIASPLAMHAHDIVLDEISLVIQLHVLAMFAPSIVMGSLIRHFGAGVIAITGTVLLVCSILANLLLATSVSTFFLSLILLGLAWNMMYLAGTTIVAQDSPPAQAYSVQAVNEVAVAVLSFSGALFPGLLMAHYQWRGVNGIALVLSMIALTLILVLLRLYQVKKRAGTN